MRGNILKLSRLQETTLLGKLPGKEKFRKKKTDS